MSTDAICTCSHGLGVLRHADDCPVAIERRQPVRPAAAAPKIESAGIRAEILDLRDEDRDVVVTAEGRIIRFVLTSITIPAGLAIGGFTFSPESGSLSWSQNTTGAIEILPHSDLIATQWHQQVAQPPPLNTLMPPDTFQFVVKPALSAPSEPVPDGPRVWAMPEWPSDWKAFEDAQGFVWRLDEADDRWKRSTGAWTDDPLRMIVDHPYLAPLTEVVEEATP